MLTRNGWRSLVAASAAAGMLGACGPAATPAAGGAPAGAAPGAGATPAIAPAAAPASIATTTFTDPTQNAFTIAAPQGWAVNGGLQRGTPWLTAASPDGASTIVVGDASIPSYQTPSAVHPQGSTWQGPAGATLYAEPYQSGVQYAQYYASTIYGPTCAPLQVTGTAAEPGFAQTAQADQAAMAAAVGVPTPQVQYDGGSATFSCQANGVAMAVGVIDVTTFSQAAGAGLWGVPILIAYRTPLAGQAQTDQLARSMRASFQRNPQWVAQMAAATRQQLAAMQQNGAAFQQALNQQQAAGDAALQQQAQIDQNQLNAEHAATMQQIETQGVDETAAYNEQQYNQETGQQSEMRYINNQQCVQWADAAHTRCAITAPN